MAIRTTLQIGFEIIVRVMTLPIFTQIVFKTLTCRYFNGGQTNHHTGPHGTVPCGQKGTARDNICSRKYSIVTLLMIVRSVNYMVFHC